MVIQNELPDFFFLLFLGSSIKYLPGLCQSQVLWRFKEIGRNDP